MPPDHLPCCDTITLGADCACSAACRQWHYFYNAQCEPASVISSLNTATAGFQVCHPVAVHTRCYRHLTSMQLFRRHPACCCARRPPQRQKPGSNLERSDCCRCCYGERARVQDCGVYVLSPMVTDRTCNLAQGYYDLPKAITDTVATESDVQMLVRGCSS